MPSKRTFMDVAIGTAAPQRIMFELDADRVPKTVENFRALCTGEKGTAKSADVPMHYKGTIFHRVIDMFMLQTGDFTKGNGTGGESIYGPTFEDEDLSTPLDAAGLLAMANKGKDTNSSQFFITLDECPHLDGKHTVFGRVVKGMEVVEQIAKVSVDSKDKPVEDVRIVNCGELIKKSAAVAQPTAPIESRRSRSPSRARSDSRSRSRSRSISTSSSRSRSPSPSKGRDRDRRRGKKSSSSRRDKKDKKDKRRKLKGLVDEYGAGTGAGAGAAPREETEEELDARLEREETERLEQEKRAKLAEMRGRFEREREEKRTREAAEGNGGVVYKGRGAMRYLDPETSRSSGRGTPSTTRGWADERSSFTSGHGRDRHGERERYGPPGGARREDHHRRDRDRSREGRPGAGAGGVQGDWRVGREMKIRGHGRDGPERIGFERATDERGQRRGGDDRGEEVKGKVDDDEDDVVVAAVRRGEDREDVDVDLEREDREMGIRRDERRGSEESMEMDMDE